MSALFQQDTDLFSLFSSVLKSQLYVVPNFDHCVPAANHKAQQLPLTVSQFLLSCSNLNLTTRVEKHWIPYQN